MFQAGLDFTYKCFNAIELVGTAYFLTRGQKIIDWELYEYKRYGFRFDILLVYNAFIQTRLSYPVQGF